MMAAWQVVAVTAVKPFGSFILPNKEERERENGEETFEKYARKLTLIHLKALDGLG